MQRATAAGLESPCCLGETKLNEAVRSALPTKGAAGYWTPWNWMHGLHALLRRVQLIIGVDSGLIQLAAASGAPNLALHGATSAALTGGWAINRFWPPPSAVRPDCLEPAITVAKDALGVICQWHHPVMLNFPPTVFGRRHWS